MCRAMKTAEQLVLIQVLFKEMLQRKLAHPKWKHGILNDVNMNNHSRADVCPWHL